MGFQYEEKPRKISYKMIIDHIKLRIFLLETLFAFFVWIHPLRMFSIRIITKYVFIYVGFNLTSVIYYVYNIVLWEWGKYGSG